MGYRQRAFELAILLDKRADIRRKSPDRKSVKEGKDDRLADQLEAAAKMLRQEIIIGPRTADVLQTVLLGGKPTKDAIQQARSEIGDLDDVVPF